MPAKRGRPVSTDTTNVETLRRRELTADRVRRHREQRRILANRRQTQEQLQQADTIVELAFTDEDAAITLTQLGLRVQGVTLAQDVTDAHRQQDAAPINEHDALYRDHGSTPRLNQPPIPRESAVSERRRPSTSVSYSREAHSSQTNVTQFFQTLPPQNPLASIPVQHLLYPPENPIPEATPDWRGGEVREGPICRERGIEGSNNGELSLASALDDVLATLPPRHPLLSAPVQHLLHPSATLPPRHPLPSTPVQHLLYPLEDPTPEVPPDWTGSDVGDKPVNGEGGRHHTEQDITPALDDFLEVLPPEGQGDETVKNQEDDSEEEGSFYSFASERSADDEIVDPGPVEVSALAFTVDKLFDQLQGGFHGCSTEQHAENLREHMSSGGDNHHSLNDIFNDPSFPSVLPLSDMISTDRLARQAVPTPEQWQSMFCGISPAQQRPLPMCVCLHQEETQAVEPQVAFDIDSFLGFARDLCFARQGFWYQPAPQMRQNMTTDVHLETPVFRHGDDPEQAARSSPAMLRDVPHFLLGRVVGAHDITVHVLFPHLVPAQDKFVSMTKEQHTRWLDQVFHPAVYRYCEAHYTQHLPASCRHALANSKANQTERRLAEAASYQAQQALGYHLQPEYLHLIWTDILRSVADTPGLHDFRDLQLFFSAKGTKLQFKTSPSRPTMLDAMENFETYFDRVIDPENVFLDRFYVDLGKEICPRVSLLPTQQAHVDDEAQIYSWKRCCLQHYLHQMYDGQPPAAGGRGQQFHDQNMLYDACNLTSVTPKTARLREGGLIYSQFYGSVKEISDAAKCRPFDNNGLEELALDPQIRQGARHTAGGRGREAHIIERAYCASKQRARDALHDSFKKSFGIREEHRISWSLFYGLLARLRRKPRDELEILLTDCPSYAWAVKTEVYLNYLWRSADKFATGFEYMRARCQHDLVTWEQTKMMAMFLRCLRFVFAGHQLSRESALWWSRRERSVGDPPQLRVWYGLGFCNTLPRYGYCWIEPRVNWDRMVFHSQVTDQILFGNSMLRGQYLRRGGQVRDFLDTTRRLELALEWIDVYHGTPAIRDRLILWMVHICLQQFRVDVLGSVKLEIAEGHREEAVRGDRGFCQEYFEEIMVGPVHLVSGNRCDFKQSSHLGHFLFDYDDGRLRTHWEDRPFRKLYRRSRTALTMRHGDLGLGQTFSRRLWRNLYAGHWILPYPSAEVFTQTTKQGQRMWYSIQAEGAAGNAVENLLPEQWEWARKSWRAGFPSRFPGYISWTKDEWQGWIDRHGG